MRTYYVELYEIHAYMKSISCRRTLIKKFPLAMYGTRTSRLRARDTETEGIHRDGSDTHGHEQKEPRTPKFDYNEYSKYGRDGHLWTKIVFDRRGS